MTQFKTFTDDERAALKLHGLQTDGPSQLSDAFVLGIRYARGVAPTAPHCRTEEIPLTDEQRKDLSVSRDVSIHGVTAAPDWRNSPETGEKLDRAIAAVEARTLGVGATQDQPLCHQPPMKDTPA